jgi:hypothetical protein
MSQWVSVEDRMPENGEIVDVYISKYEERHCNYEYTRDYNGQLGNNFFDPISGGLSCIRNASHWMYAPEPPTK